MNRQERKLTTKDSWEAASIDEYVNDVGLVWGSQDAGRSVIDVWLRVVQHASELGEVVRRGKLDAVQEQLGHIAIWMLSFAAKTGTARKGAEGLFSLTRPLSEVIWRKYPNCCHACFTRRAYMGQEHWQEDIVECNCVMTLAETEERGVLLTDEQKSEAKRLRREHADRAWTEGRSDYQKLSLMQLERRFEHIFKRSIFAQDLEHVTFHFLEEVGEVTQELTNLYTYRVPAETAPETLTEDWRSRRPDYEDELADSFSWLFAVSSKLRDTFKVFDNFSGTTKFAEHMHIVGHLIKRHRREFDSHMKCYVCGDDVCHCQFNLITDDDSADKITRTSQADMRS